MRRRRMYKARQDIYTSMEKVAYGVARPPEDDPDMVIDLDKAQELAAEIMDWWTMGPVNRLHSTVRLSRPCYDKMHRCPGWAGGGSHGARISRCDDGRLIGGPSGELYEGRWWKFRMNRCNTCGLLVLPYVIRYLDWRHWKYEIRTLFRYTIPFAIREFRRR